MVSEKKVAKGSFVVVNVISIHTLKKVFNSGF